MDSSIGVAIALGAFFIWALVIFNGLVARRSHVAAALAHVDVESKRRRDLVPNLVEAARSSMAHEQQTLQAVLAARDTAQSAATAAAGSFADAEAVAARAHGEDDLSSALNRFLAQAESLPELRSNQSVLQLSQEITVTDERLSSARRSYNQAVAHYNAALQAFPAVMFASALGFKPAVPLGSAGGGSGGGGGRRG